MSACIHCRHRKATRGLYCDLCWLAAKARAAQAAGKEHARTCVPGVQRQKFDDGTCPCHRTEMHFRGSAGAGLHPGDPT